MGKQRIFIRGGELVDGHRFGLLPVILITCSLRGYGENLMESILEDFSMLLDNKNGFWY